MSRPVITVLSVLAMGEDDDIIKKHIKNLEVPFRTQREYKIFRLHTISELKRQYGENIRVYIKTEKYD